MPENLYNVTGEADKLKELKAKFPAAVVEDRFNNRDMNLSVLEDQEDDFRDYCEQNGITCKLV